MSEPLLPKSVQELILSRIESVAQLEALLLMRRNQEHSFTPTELAAHLYIKPEEAGSVLDALAARGLCAVNGTGIQFQPETPELAAQVNQLADAYREKLILVTQLIHQRSREKPAAQKFADVFRFRKED